MSSTSWTTTADGDSSPVQSFHVACAQVASDEDLRAVTGNIAIHPTPDVWVNNRMGAGPLEGVMRVWG